MNAHILCDWFRPRIPLRCVVDCVMVSLSLQQVSLTHINYH